jgi:hypothetical protein
VTLVTILSPKNQGAAMKWPKYRVIKEHKASFTFALLAAEGDEVTIGKEDPEMPGWFWCKSKGGVEMWVPRTYIALKGTVWRFTQDYNSTELSVKVGETVQIIGESLGWAECLNGEWCYGWIPINKLEPLP